MEGLSRRHITSHFIPTLLFPPSLHSIPLGLLGQGLRISGDLCMKPEKGRICGTPQWGLIQRSPASKAAFFPRGIDLCRLEIHWNSRTAPDPPGDWQPHSPITSFSCILFFFLPSSQSTFIRSQSSDFPASLPWHPLPGESLAELPSSCQCMARASCMVSSSTSCVVATSAGQSHRQ